MAPLLARIGAASFRRRRTVLAIWLTLLALVGAGALAGGASFVTNFTVPGTESQAANDLLLGSLPAAAGGSARVAFAAPEGEQLDGERRELVAAAVREIDAQEPVASASDPFETGTVSPDGRIAFTQLAYAVSPGEITSADRDALAEATAPAEAAGVQVAVGGDAADPISVFAIGEVIGVFVAVLVLAITFGSLAAAGMPLATAGVGVGIGLAGVVGVAALIDLSNAVLSLAAMLGLAVGIDYALFIVARHRGQVQQGMGLEASAGRAVGTAGSAVVFAGAAVVVALVALAVTGVPFLTAMGLAAAATVAIAVLVALTLVPAVLGFAGERAVAGKRFESAADDPDARTYGARWVGLVTRHRVVAVLLVLVTTLAVAIPAMGMRFGLPDDSWSAPGTDRRDAYDLITQGFGPGFSGTLTLLTELGSDGDVEAAGGALRAALADREDVVAVAPPTPSPDGTVAVTQVIPGSGPSSQATEDLVSDIRADVAPVLREDGIDLTVTGATAVNIDVAERMGEVLVPYLAVVVGLAFVLLTIAFRSLLVPLTAVAGFLLTIAASLGAMVGVFQEGFAAGLFGVAEPNPVVSIVPVIMVGILFGLAMDYQVFLVSRMREAVAGGASPPDAITTGFKASARVVTAAALIMISVFAGFILASDPIVKAIGFGLAVGILVDAFLVRMTLIPAVMSLMGARAWWLPGWLERIVPNVDVEGAGLERERVRS